MSIAMQSNYARIAALMLAIKAYPDAGSSIQIATAKNYLDWLLEDWKVEHHDEPTMESFLISFNDLEQFIATGKLPNRKPRSTV